MITYGGGGKNLPLVKLGPGGRMAARVTAAPREVTTKYGRRTIVDISVIGGREATLFLPAAVAAAAPVLQPGILFVLGRGDGEKSAHYIKIPETKAEEKTVEREKPIKVTYLERRNGTE